jgi:hypothetical protein
MHVLSTEQCRDLLASAAPALSGGDATATQTGPLFDSLLDVGAGEGRVTSCLAPLFRQISATDVVGPMVWRLNRRGYDG